MNIFYLKNIFYEHSKNEKFNYLQTVKIDSSTQFLLWILVHPQLGRSNYSEQRTL